MKDLLGLNFNKIVTNCDKLQQIVTFFVMICKIVTNHNNVVIFAIFVAICQDLSQFYNKCCDFEFIYIWVVSRVRMPLSMGIKNSQPEGYQTMVHENAIFHPKNWIS
jgi:hypothetical protein